MILKLKKLLAITVMSALAAAVCFPLNVKAAEDAPVTFVNFDMDVNVVNLGDEITLKITTSSSAEAVSVNYDLTTEAGTLTGIERNGNKNWTLQFSPEVSQKVTVSAGKSAEDTDAAVLTIPVIVNNVTAGADGLAVTTSPGVAINSVFESSTDKIAMIIIGTSLNVNNVWVNFDGNLYMQGDLLATHEDSKVWIIKFAPSSAQTVTVSANIAYKTNGAVNESFELTQYTGRFSPRVLGE